MSVKEKVGGKRRTNQQISSAAVLATGAELSRRGYDVMFTLGNTARIDMLCAAPDGEAFRIQVKGISTANGFYIDKSFFEGQIQTNLFLVVVLVPPVPRPREGPQGVRSCFLHDRGVVCRHGPAATHRIPRRALPPHLPR